VNYQRELLRKLIHYGSSIFPFIYYNFFSRAEMLWLLGGLSAIFLLAEILRMNISIFKHLFKRFFGPIVRVSESNKFTGATSVFISGFLTVLIFEKNIAIFAMLTLSLADATAALIGKKWGKRKLFDKTLEGSLTFLIVSIGLAIILPDLFRLGAIVAAIVATLIELFPSPIDDNLMIPISIATTLSLFHLIP
jgi:dolichol kinase|tara:strand:+ start:2420 stop:2998 length:579 start_codon:yes stop_codon:yes gene_type:complete